MQTVSVAKRVKSGDENQEIQDIQECARRQADTQGRGTILH